MQLGESARSASFSSIDALGERFDSGEPMVVVFGPTYADAHGLARKSTRPVVLVDADLQFGDIAVMLKLTPQHTVVDAVSAMQRLDAQLLQSLLVRHDSSGVLVLPAPLEPAFADQVSAADLAKIVQVLKTFASYVVIDTPAQFNDVVLNLLEASD